ncbi:MAG: CDGSH iron-sulfur domain-containing protein [Algicola sp.]|nr:CDGSH iron-sulfur domain-containing protein [Algicola sp.]
MTEPTASSGKVASDRPMAVEVEAGKSYHWCSCGKSTIQPWCDGAHAGTVFKPVIYKAQETKTVYMCCCKKTHHAPTCDGSHQFINDSGRDAYYCR